MYIISPTFSLTMFTSLFTLLCTVIMGLISGLLYAQIFFKYPFPTTPTMHDTWRKRSIINALARFIVMTGVFWYLLRLPITDRILFLTGFIYSFWYFIFVLQRRYYGRN